MGRRSLGIALITVGAVLAASGAAGLILTSGDEEPTEAASPQDTETEDEPAPAETPTPDPSPEPDPKVIVSDFVAELAAAIQTGDQTFLFSSLDARVIRTYGAKQCRAFLGGFSDPSSDLVPLKVRPPAPWDWVVDGVSTTIPDAYEVVVEQHQGDQKERRTTHFTLVNGAVKWFTDCGSPRGAA